MDLSVRFLQAAIRPSALHSIKLVQEIPGSDRWPVRDLFQREVDTDRVSKYILPWLENAEKVKFFSPLTLTLIPLDQGRGSARSIVSSFVRQDVTDSEGRAWRILKNEPYFRFRFPIDGGQECPEGGILEWDSSHTSLVAIDGQHRLSALKRYMSDPSRPGHAEFQKWHIPVVICGIDQLQTREKASVSNLDVVRSMFVYINTQARVPSLARQILLNDESPNYVCCQELLQHSHENDVVDDPAARDSERLPLLFYDWRDLDAGGRVGASPAAIKSITEIASWLEHYVLGADYSEDQYESLDVESGSDALQDAFKRKRMLPESAVDLRAHFRKTVLPGISTLFQNFRPYAEYRESIARLERDWLAKGEPYQHALSQLRFGSHKGKVSEAKAIHSAYEEIVEDLIDLKSAIPHLLALDIGMRGILSSFGDLYWTEDFKGNWLTYSQWFTKYLNQVYDQDWFGSRGSRLRLHITHNAAGLIVNHKIGDATKALGPLVSILVCGEATKSRDRATKESMQEVWDECTERLMVALRAGYRTQHRAELRTRHPELVGRDLTERVRTVANKSTHAHIARLRKALEVF